MEYFCENCVSEVNQQLCRGCHIMLKDGKAVYSNFMPTKAALKSAELAATDSQQLKQAIALLHRWQGPERQDSHEAQIKLEVESSQLMKSVAQRACV